MLYVIKAQISNNTYFLTLRLAEAIVKPILSGRSRVDTLERQITNGRVVTVIKI
jgi:hypothetical protein